MISSCCTWESSSWWPRSFRAFFLNTSSPYPLSIWFWQRGGGSFFQESPLPDLADDPYLGKRLTELGVIISLTAAGLKLKEPFAWKT
jgi:hypothetical protein